MTPEPPSPETAHALLRVAAGLEAGLLEREPRGFASVQEAVIQALACYPDNGGMMLRVAQLLDRWGQAEASEALVARAIRLKPASTQPESEMADRCERRGDIAGAHDWCWQMVLTDPFSVNAGLRCANLKFRLGDDQGARALLDHLESFESKDPRKNADWAELLWRHGRAYQSIPKFEAAYAAGMRDAQFLQDFMDLLSGETLYPRVLELPVFGEPGAGLRAHSLMRRGHAKLAIAVDRPAILEAAVAREGTARWLDPAGAKARIADAIKARKPFSMMRMGDGEARFLIRMLPSLQADMTPEEAAVMGNIIWTNWFGETVEQTDAGELADLVQKLLWSIDQTDLLGVSDAVRLRQDTGHFGYLAAQEAFLDARLAANADILRFSALAHYDLANGAQSLPELLAGESFIGVISPHPDLDERLQRYLQVGAVRSYPVPGEARLPNHQEMRDRKRHFPERYHEILETLEVPFPGAVFLVGAGLLGKVYCGRIKQLGGIALDIGAVVDGWMGLNTRPSLLDVIPTLK
jgi:hypothetical protein